MYTQSITRNHRAAIVVAIDRSGSMSGEVEYNGSTRTKAELVCEVVNTILFELIESARRHDGIHDYYDISIISYSGRGVEPILGDEWVVPISQIAKNRPRTIEQWSKRPTPSGEFRMVKSTSYEWITPLAEGQTPMYEALCEVHNIVKRWCQEPQNRESFPPIIFNITDGEASDCNPESLLEISESIRAVHTLDGNALLVNCHIASQVGVQEVVFPSSKQEIGENKYAHTLYDASSIMPEQFCTLISQIKQTKGSNRFRGMSFNSSIHELLTMLNIGSRSLPIH